jgi:hypothetical protein
VKWPAHPVIHEINTAVWLDELSRTAGRQLTLADVGPADWEAGTPPEADAVWLMGVWERSPAGLAIAEENAELQASFRDALPDLRRADVIGSPYCVRRYVVDAAFGGPDGLASARAALADRGMGLVLDYVPNHVAPDHPWVTTRPELFIQGDGPDVEADPSAWIAAAGHVLARGRDPYFPPWPDVVQLNAFAPALRAASTDTLIDIASQCDGIRCDMAMLMINRVFGSTWGERAGERPDEEFWPGVIDAVHSQHPDAVLIAEAYWDMEGELMQQGFDYCYDKRLYDRIVASDAPAVREHLRADLAYQSKLLRFLENHDEPRIAARLSIEAEKAAAVAIATLPGATLWHEGQFEGRRVRPPVFLSRRPDELLDAQLAAWYRRLLTTVSSRKVRTGRWQLLEATGWPDNQSCDNVLAWSWSDGDATHVVAVNFSARPAQARIHLDAGGAQAAGDLRFEDLLTGGEYVRDASEVADLGLYVELQPWESYIFGVDRVSPRPEALVSH